MRGARGGCNIKSAIDSKLSLSLLPFLFFSLRYTHPTHSLTIMATPQKQGKPTRIHHVACHAFPPGAGCGGRGDEVIDGG